MSMDDVDFSITEEDGSPFTDEEKELLGAAYKAARKLTVDLAWDAPAKPKNEADAKRITMRLIWNLKMEKAKWNLRRTRNAMASLKATGNKELIDKYMEEFKEFETYFQMELLKLTKNRPK